MLLTLGPHSCTRDHGYVRDLDLVGPDVDELTIDAGAVRGIAPLAAVRIAMALAAARARGCRARVEPPADPGVRSTFDAYSIPAPMTAADARIGGPGSEVILPCTSLARPAETDLLEYRLVEPLGGHFNEVVAVRKAVLTAIGELSQNAVEHGASRRGSLVAIARRESRGVGTVSLAIGDLGVGVPDHIRRTQPRYVLDHHAIGRALEEGVSGTRGAAHRGYGFYWVLLDSLTSASTAAEMVIRSGRGTFRRRMVDGRCQDDGWESAPIAGTWIAYEWTTVVEA
jgi:hypothetical protein